MALIGNQIRQYSDRVVLDSLTASATADYTLQLNSTDFVPSSAESLTVSLNGIIQKPQDSYTVSNSTLTFASALTASDSIDFVIAERGITLQTPSAGSVGTSQLASSAVSTAKIANDAVTKDKLIGHNYPAFFAYHSDATGQSIPSNVWTKVQVDDEIFDTDNCYDNTTNYRFTPNIAGKYLLQAQANMNIADTFVYHLNIRKNGIELYSRTGVQYISATNIGQHTSYLVEANGTTDYFEFYIYNVRSSAINLYPNSTYTWFCGHRIGD